MKIFLNNVIFEFLDYPRQVRGALTQTVKGVEDVQSTFERVQLGKMPEIQHLIFVHEAPERLFNTFRAYFVEVPAAGGIVRYEDTFLLMRRRGYWDLPKGKIDGGETPAEAAVREVKEECGLKKVHILRYLTHSWHIYQAGGQLILKPTSWYEMESPDKEGAQPQHSEGITELRWVKHQKATKLLRSSFASLSHVFSHLQPPAVE